MPRYAQACIDVAGIVAVDIAERAPQTILVRWHRDDVYMIWHQTIGPDLDPRAHGGLRQEIEVEFVVAVLEERSLAPIAALGDVVRDAGQDRSWKASHVLMLRIAGCE